MIATTRLFRSYLEGVGQDFLLVWRRSTVSCLFLMFLATLTHAQNWEPSFEDGASAYNEGEYAVAFDIWHHLAVRGDPAAQFLVGELYALGHGTTFDLSEMVRWHLMSAEQGFAPAQAKVGGHYLVGMFVEQDHAEAVRMFRLAAEQGNARGIAGLASMYSLGSGGLLQDYQEALRLNRIAAQLGDVEGQEQLGQMYWDGEGVPVDLVTAHMWFNIAVSNGRDPTLRNMVAQEMTPEQIAEAQSRARVCLASGYQDCE